MGRTKLYYVIIFGMAPKIKQFILTDIIKALFSPLFLMRFPELSNRQFNSLLNEKKNQVESRNSAFQFLDIQLPNLLESFEHSIVDLNLLTL